MVASMQLMILAASVATMATLSSAALHRGSASLRITKLHTKKAIQEPFGVLEENKKPFPWPYTIDDERCPTGWWRVGCVKDTQNDQKRWYHLSVPKEDQEPISVKVCATWCKNVTGTQFFGVENGDKCYCTPFFHDTNKGGNGACDLPCVGNNAEMCGGQYLTDIYQMHDCNNLPPVPCKVPPAMVPFARTFKSRYYRKADIPCENAINN